MLEIKYVIDKMLLQWFIQLWNTLMIKCFFWLVSVYMWVKSLFYKTGQEIQYNNIAVWNKNTFTDVSNLFDMKKLRCQHENQLEMSEACFKIQYSIQDSYFKYITDIGIQPSQLKPVLDEYIKKSKAKTENLQEGVRLLAATSADTDITKIMLSYAGPSQDFVECNVKLKHLQAQYGFTSVNIMNSQLTEIKFTDPDEYIKIM